MTSSGHAGIQSSQPLHLTMSTSIFGILPPSIYHKFGDNIKVWKVQGKYFCNFFHKVLKQNPAGKTARDLRKVNNFNELRSAVVFFMIALTNIDHGLFILIKTIVGFIGDQKQSRRHRPTANLAGL